MPNVWPVALLVPSKAKCTGPVTLQCVRIFGQIKSKTNFQNSVHTANNDRFRAFPVDGVGGCPEPAYPEFWTVVLRTSILDSTTRMVGEPKQGSDSRRPTLYAAVQFAPQHSSYGFPDPQAQVLNRPTVVVPMLPDSGSGTRSFQN